MPLSTAYYQRYVRILEHIHTWIEQVIKIKHAITKIKDENNEENKFALEKSVSIKFYYSAVSGSLPVC